MSEKRESGTLRQKGRSNYYSRASYVSHGSRKQVRGWPLNLWAWICLCAHGNSSRIYVSSCSTNEVSPRGEENRKIQRKQTYLNEIRTGILEFGMPPRLLSLGVRRLRSTLNRPPIPELRPYQKTTDHGVDKERESACLRAEHVALQG